MQEGSDRPASWLPDLPLTKDPEDSGMSTASSEIRVAVDSA
jgi:hypothetical protein